MAALALLVLLQLRRRGWRHRGRRRRRRGSVDRVHSMTVLEGRGIGGCAVSRRRRAVERMWRHVNRCWCSVCVGRDVGGMRRRRNVGRLRRRHAPARRRRGSIRRGSEIRCKHRRMLVRWGKLIRLVWIGDVWRVRWGVSSGGRRRRRGINWRDSDGLRRRRCGDAKVDGFKHCGKRHGQERR